LAVDCNNNGVEDAIDIADETSEDCQPDGIPDECQLSGTFTNNSGTSSPSTSEQTLVYSIVAPPPARGPVTLTFMLEASTRFGTIMATLNGVFVGNLNYECGAPAPTPIVMSESSFNTALAGGDAVIRVGPSNNEWDFECNVSLSVNVSYPDVEDCNGNQVPDDCDAADAGADCNLNEVPDICEAGGTDDCNETGTVDLCDIHSAVSEDCNGNFVPDECDLTSGEPDSDGDGLMDACEPPGVGDDLCYVGNESGGPCSANDDCPGAVCGLKSRYITLESLALVPRTIRVTILAMRECSAGPNIRRGCETNNHCPGGTCINSPRIGDVWWARPEMSIPNSPNPPLRGARLECTGTPHSQAWTTGYLHLFGAVIVPGSRYDVRMCNPDGSGCSAPVVVETSKWGDAVRPFGGGSQPNFADIEAALRRFGNQATAPDLPRVDFTGVGNPGAPNTPNQATNFADISNDVSAFMGFPYAYTVPACP